MALDVALGWRLRRFWLGAGATLDDTLDIAIIAAVVYFMFKALAGVAGNRAVRRRNSDEDELREGIRRLREELRRLREETERGKDGNQRAQCLCTF